MRGEGVEEENGGDKEKDGGLEGLREMNRGRGRGRWRVSECDDLPLPEQ